MVTEIELKYSLLEGKDITGAKSIKETISNIFSERGLTFEHQEKYLSNYYFDTADLTLRKNRIALRTRGTSVVGESEHFEQTIKTSGTVIAGLHQRPEYNVDIDTAKPTLALFPDSIWQANTNLEQLQQQITELFTTNFNRNTWLVNIDSSQVEVAFDCGQIKRQGNSAQPAIFEIELELMSGETEALFILTKLLFSCLALRPGQLTKAARGYALYNESISGKGAAPSKTLPITDLATCIERHDDFSTCIEYSLKYLQLSIDSYVVANSAVKAQRFQDVCDKLILLEDIIRHFDMIASPDEVALGKELSAIIELLTAYSRSSESTDSVDEQKRESNILALLHGERFNNLQLALLITLLKRNNNEK